MRIKGEGDYNAIKELVDKYGTHFDPVVRNQVLERYKALDLPTYWAGINADLSNKNGAVTISYPRDAIKQYLHYGAMYDSGIGRAPCHPDSKTQSQTKNKTLTTETKRCE